MTPSQDLATSADGVDAKIDGVGTTGPAVVKANPERKFRLRPGVGAYAQ